MANASVDGNAVWYPLSAHDDSSSPLGPPTPVQSPSGVGNVGGKKLRQLSHTCKVCFLFDSTNTVDFLHVLRFPHVETLNQ